MVSEILAFEDGDIGGDDPDHTVTIEVEADSWAYIQIQNDLTDSEYEYLPFALSGLGSDLVAATSDDSEDNTNVGLASYADGAIYYVETGDDYFIYVFNKDDGGDHSFTLTVNGATYGVAATGTLLSLLLLSSL
jgi:hypothetical protein